MVKKIKTENTLKFDQIAVRVEKSLKDAIDLAAICEGIPTPDWVRAALNSYLLTKTNICKNCGTFNSLDSKYCKKCGGELINIQQRFINRRKNILDTTALSFRLILDLLSFVASDKELTQGCMINPIPPMMSLIESWFNNKSIIYKFEVEILKYDLDSEEKKEFDYQNNLITKFNELEDLFSMDIVEYRNVKNPDWKLIWKKYEKYR